jgi:hypothetical protein
MKTVSLFFVIFLFVLTPSFASDIDSTTCKKKDSTYVAPFRKNNVKLCLSHFLLYREGYVLTYERVIGKHSSLSISAGYTPIAAQFDLDIDLFEKKKQIENYGFMVGSEYRFYLKAENKYKAPRGVFIGPFTTFYQFRSNRLIQFEEGNAASLGEMEFNTRFSVLNIGGQAGYQFLIKNRVSIDLVMFGPALSFYGYQFKLNKDLTETDLNETQQQLADALKEKFPLLQDLVSGDPLKKKGTIDLWAFGFRYLIQVGIVF